MALAIVAAEDGTTRPKPLYLSAGKLQVGARLEHELICLFGRSET